MAVFFIPGVGSEHVEAKYAEFARAVRRPVPRVEGRIQSITFTVDGEEWTAGVGEQLHGVRTTRRRGQTSSPFDLTGLVRTRVIAGLSRIEYLPVR